MGPFAGPGMGSITVPYMPKTSPFFPKFVDPKTMISKKTDMLSNLFGGMGPMDYSMGGPAPFSEYPPGFVQPRPILYATNVEAENQAIKDSTITDDPVGKDKMKRGIFGPGPKVSPFFPFAPNFSPFAPQFGPPVPGFPFAGVPSKFGPGFYGSETVSSRRRRSVVETEGEGTKALGPPPAYPGLAPIAEEPENTAAKLLKLYDAASAVPKETLPGLFGPFGPFSPYAAPPVDPMMMAAKKTAFLDSLFKSLATSTPAADGVLPDLPVTEVPIPKSTIVPPDFWLPTAIIPGPGEYTEKVGTFLEKLFAHIVNKTATTGAETGKTVFARSLTDGPVQPKIMYSRSVEDIKMIAAAKDAIVDSIIAELSDLKTDMIATLNDYILYVKTAPLLPGAKKPSPFAKKPSPFAAFFAPPTADPTLPFKQRMAALSQVFDMLTGLEKNITIAVQEAMKASTNAPAVPDSLPENVPAQNNDEFLGPASNYPSGNFNGYNYPAMYPGYGYNMTLIDAIKSRLASMDKFAGNGFARPIGADYQGKRNTRNSARTPMSFWVAYLEDDTAPAKRDVDDLDYEVPERFENRHNERDQYKRAVQMQMHQGYQSMPPGTIESVQAGGGSIPGHQGGGIKLLVSITRRNLAEERAVTWHWVIQIMHLRSLISYETPPSPSVLNSVGSKNCKEIIIIFRSFTRVKVVMLGFISRTIETMIRDTSVIEEHWRIEKKRHFLF